MQVNFIILDTTTGKIVRFGAAARADLKKHAFNPGELAVETPERVFSSDGSLPDLQPLMISLHAKIDDEAEAMRLRFITPGAGQSMTYDYKAAEAVAWLADNEADTPFIAEEARRTGRTVADVVSEVSAQRSLWIPIGAKIEGERIAAKRAVSAASTLLAMALAAEVDWDGLLTP